MCPRTATGAGPLLEETVHVDSTDDVDLAPAELEFKPIGPYSILGVLGEGGMGVVYRARHSGTAQMVALKTVKLANPAYLSSMRREILRMRSLSHPAVVRVLDDGVHDGLPWYAMELLLGSTWDSERRLPSGRSRISTVAVDSNPSEVRSATTMAAPIEAIPITTPVVSESAISAPPSAGPVTTGRPITSGELLTLIRRARLVCDALAYIHGEGVVHLDLKPSNVFVRPNGQPVLIDFGLVTGHGGSQGREELDVSVLQAGTLGYMAPEQIAGELADARADIFAMGCVLYEQITGRLPFATAPSERLESVARGAPPPSAFASACPVELDRLVLGMLASDRRDRIGHADDVSDALRALERKADSVPPSDPGSARARPYLYRAGFAGRDRLVEELLSRARRVRSREGGFALLGGESGGGKTRVLMEVARLASLSRVLVVTGECTPLGAATEGASRPMSAPLHALRPLLQTVADICRMEGPATTAALLGKRLRVLTPFLPALSEVPGAANFSELPALPPDAARDRVLASVAETIAALAEVRPLVLVLDDLQWADALTLDVLAHLTRPGASPIKSMILGAYRLEEMRPEISMIASREGALSFSLDRLDERSVGSLIGDMLGQKDPPPDLARFVSGRAEGNPFYVTEYLRTILAEGVLRRGRDGKWTLAGASLDPQSTAAPSSTSALERLALPRSVRDLVERHLQSIGPELRELVGAASVLGREVRAEILGPLTGLGEEELAIALNELLRRHIFGLAEGGGYRFTHDKLHETAYAALPSPERVRLHRAAAVALEGRGVDVRDLEIVARHWDRAGVDDKARDYFIRAGEHALATGAHRQAAAVLSRALELSPDGSIADDRLARLYRLHADALFAVGDTKLGAEHASRALRLSGVRVPQGTAQTVAAILSGLGEQLFRMTWGGASGAPRDEETALERTRAAACFTTCCVAEFRPPAEILSATILGANLADRAGPRGAKAIPYSVLGAMFGFAGLSGLAQRYFDGARRDSSERADLVSAASYPVMETLYYVAATRFEEAFSHIDEAATIAAEIGDRNAWDTLLAIRGSAEVLQGRLHDAEATYQAVRRSATERGGQLILASGVAHRSRIELLFDRPHASIETLAEARPLFGGNGGGQLAVAVGPAGAASLWLGDDAQARELAEEALTILQQNAMFFGLWTAVFWTFKTFLDLWEKARREGQSAGDLEKKTRAAGDLVRSLGRVSRVGALMSDYAEGALARASGRSARAKHLLDRTIERAPRMGVPFVEIHARLERALLLPDASPRRIDEARRAQEEAERMGSPYWTERAIAIAEGRAHWTRKIR